MEIPERIEHLPNPPFDSIHERVEYLIACGQEVIDLSQGVPGYSFHTTEVKEAVLKAVEDQETYRYSLGSGLLSLRKLVANNLSKYNSLEADPDSEILITAGANQAFLLALFTLVNPRDIILLPSPYYISHAMAVQAVGAIPVEVPLSEERGFQLRAEDINPFLHLNPRLLVIVSPNNPTGAVYDPEDIRQVIELAIQHKILVLTDETYQPFVFEGKRHFSPRSVREYKQDVLTIGSFSKMFNLCGWRVGYLLGPELFIQHALKLQEPVIICPPVISQKVVASFLEKWGLDVSAAVKEIGELREIMVANMSRMKSVKWIPTQGAFFAFMKYRSSLSSVELALKILKEVNVAVTPGSAFGRYGEGFFRLSYGSIDRKTLAEACQRLTYFFANQ